MYDAPFTGPVTAGWILAGLVVVLVATRAVRTEGRPGRTGSARLVDVGLDVVVGLAVLALLVVLAGVLAAGL